MNIYVNNSIVDSIKSIVKNEKKNKDFTWHYLFIVSYIRTAPFFDRTYYNKNYVNLNLDLLRKLVSKDYAKKFLDDLVNYGIIECDNHFYKSSKSKGYRLKEEFKKDKFKLLKIKDEELNSKLDNILLKELKELLESTSSYGYVTQCMEKLDLDRPKALRYVRDKMKDDKEKRVDFCKTVIDIFTEKFAHVDDVGNRLHNNLTNAPSEFRKYLSYKGEKLWQCDIRNSQPLFLYCFLRDNCIVSSEELEKYRNVVCNYGFYEFFAEKLNIILDASNRGEFKKNIFGGVLFNSNKKDLSDYEKVFKQEFPEIFFIVRKIKSESYKDVAIMLQKTESKFIFTCIDELMFITKKQAPLFTIHDSISTTEKYIKTVEKVMSERFEKDYGVITKIKIEKF